MKNEKAILISSLISFFLLGSILMFMMLLKDEKFRQDTVKIFQSRQKEAPPEIWPRVELQTRQN